MSDQSSRQLTVIGQELRPMIACVRRLQLPDGYWVEVYEAYSTEQYAIFLTVSARLGFTTMTTPLDVSVTVQV